MTSKREFYKTTITLVVLSEDHYDPDSLEGIADDIRSGNCSGEWDITKSEKVDGPTMATLLIEQASSPEFFQLDEDGNDLDEDEEEEDKEWMIAVRCLKEKQTRVEVELAGIFGWRTDDLYQDPEGYAGQVLVTFGAYTEEWEEEWTQHLDVMKAKELILSVEKYQE